MNEKSDLPDSVSPLWELIFANGGTAINRDELYGRFIVDDRRAGEQQQRAMIAQLQLLGPAFNPNISSNETTPLMLALGKGWGLLARHLLSHGADPDFPNSNGQRPLSAVCNMAMLELLLEYNPDVNFPVNKKGLSPLSVLLCDFGVPAAELLLQKGARLDLAVVDGQLQQDLLDYFSWEHEKAVLWRMEAASDGKDVDGVADNWLAESERAFRAALKFLVDLGVSMLVSVRCPSGKEAPFLESLRQSPWPDLEGFVRSAMARRVAGAALENKSAQP